MKRHMSCALLAVIIIYKLLQSSESCHCKSQRLVDRFCDADFAIRATVLELSRVKQRTEHKYKVRLDHDFVPIANMSFDCDYVYGHAENEDCSTVLDVGTQYVMTGHYVTPWKPFIDDCSWIEPWVNLSSELQNLTLFYNDTCGPTNLHD